MDYTAAWVIYLTMALLFMLGYERYIASLLAGQREKRIFLRAFLAIMLFTPGVVIHGDMLYMTPACVGIVFNILVHNSLGVLQSILPLLAAGFVVFGLLALWEIRRTAKPWD